MPVPVTLFHEATADKLSESWRERVRSADEPFAEWSSINTGWELSEPKSTRVVHEGPDSTKATSVGMT